MSLIYDRRKEFESVAAAHALVVGVSGYELPELEVRSPVVSAAAVANWLMTHDLAVPLCTCRALLSPPSGVVQPQLEGSGSPSPATVDQFLRAASDWREDARSNRENITLFYFCGQGFQRSATEDLMLFGDFGSLIGPALRAAVSVDNLFQGMAPGTDAKIARTQLYFIDTGRTHQTSERFQLSRPTMIFDEYRTGPDDRSAVIFYSTAPGDYAWAKSGEVSVFTNALLRCLDGEAAVAVETSPTRWGITVDSLIQGLRKLMDKTSWLPQTQAPVVVVGGLVRDHVVRYLQSAPVTDITVSIENAIGASELRVENPDGDLVYSGVVAHGGSVQFPAPSGFYVIRARDAGGSRKASTIASVQPGASDVRLVMVS